MTENPELDDQVLSDEQVEALGLNAVRTQVPEEEKLRMEQANAEYFRLELLRCAVTFASNPNWTGHAGHVIAVSQLFDDYVRTGKRPTEHQLKTAAKGNR